MKVCVHKPEESLGSSVSVSENPWRKVMETRACFVNLTLHLSKKRNGKKDKLELKGAGKGSE